ncbi:MAG TPA: hypothetical protein VFM94_02425 [Solirubrobacterales bacterium]|nr:hypothetical protein [Solirubrobacterales bacterium]
MSALEQLAERSDRGFPNLTEARARTEHQLSEMRGRLAAVSCDPDVCVALFGSWGRGELTAHSDDDWAILVNGSEHAKAHPTPSQVEEAIGSEDRKPGTQGIFASLVACDHLVDHIGLDGDDNKNLTRRMLLLLESTGALNEDAHLACRSRVLNGYLDDSVKEYRPPRFLLNDLIRYWRTICVDFVGKEREGAGQKWALRNLKLGLSRKALFAGGLLPVLLCHRFAAADIRLFLAETLERPSIDRIAWAFLELDAVDAGVRAIGAYDRFIGLLGDREARTELEQLSRDEARGSEVFNRGKDLVGDFQQGLLALLFETRLESLVREYGIF